MLHYHDLLLTGGDSSRRHMVPDLTIDLLDDLSLLTNLSLRELKSAGLRYNIPGEIVKPNFDLAKHKKECIDPYKDCTPPTEILEAISSTSTKLSKELDIPNFLSHDYKDRDNSRLN